MTQAVTFNLTKAKLWLDLTKGSSPEESRPISVERENAKADRGGNKSVSEKLAA
jgi:hypothetical protein